MRRPEKHLYVFGPFSLDATERVLRRDKENLPLTPKVFEILVALVEASGHVLERDELMRRVWPDAFVEENNLTQSISTLRKLLGEGASGDRYIETVPRRGYRFVAEVREVFEESAESRISTRTSIVVSEEEIHEADAAQGYGVAPGAAAKEEAVAQPAGAAPVSSSPGAGLLRGSLLNRARRKGKAALALAAIAISAAILAYKLIGREPHGPDPAKPSRNPTITRLTSTGNVRCSAISLDGKYVAYAVTDSAYRSSLWIKHLPTNSDTQIIPSGEVSYHGLTFSPQGDYIYYTRKDNQSHAPSLYQVPFPGGRSNKLIENVDSPVSFSPDGSRMVFRRRHVTHFALLVANSDGSGEQQIATIQEPEFFGAPSWSPDGKVIACAAGHADGGYNRYVIEVRAEDWVMKPLSPRRWPWVGEMAWVADGSGLVMVARDRLSGPDQIWRLSYPGGEARRITNDLNQYYTLSLATNPDRLLASQVERDTQIWMVTVAGGIRAAPITFGTGGYRGWLSWAPDGRIVYDSLIGELETISIMDQDGSNPKPMLGDIARDAVVGRGSVTPDGRYLIFAGDLTGTRHIWRMDMDGGNLAQLTNGPGEDSPHCAPDGRWVVYTDIGSQRPTLWRAPIAGGEAIQVTEAHATDPAVSPDGKLIAAYYQDALLTGRGAVWRIALFPFAGGKPVRIFPQQAWRGPNVRWTPDGRAVTYAEDLPAGPSRIWLQPVDGGKAKLLIEFGTDRVFGFDWSRDGKQLACVRGIWAQNLALMTDFE